MEFVSFNSEHIKEMISEEAITLRIRELAAEISTRYAGQSLCLLAILKGGAFFACELAKRITVPVEMEFIRVSSYGSSCVSSGKVVIDGGLDFSAMGKNILVVEDIIDTGKTLKAVKDLLLEKKPASLALCTLLDKPDRRVVPVQVDYCGFTIPDTFVVGYGLDYAQQYRNLPYIGSLTPEVMD